MRSLPKIHELTYIFPFRKRKYRCDFIGRHIVFKVQIFITPQNTDIVMKHGLLYNEFLNQFANINLIVSFLVDIDWILFAAGKG